MNKGKSFGLSVMVLIGAACIRLFGGFIIMDPVAGLSILVALLVLGGLIARFAPKGVPTTTKEENKAPSEDKVITEKKGDFYEITLPKSCFVFECPDCGKALQRDINECTNCGAKFKKNT